MDPGNIIVILAIIIGVLAIVMSFFIKDKKVIEKTVGEHVPKETAFNPKSYQEQEDMMKDVNQKILELNDYASFVKQEISDKHKELLFLYQLITEKERNMKQEIKRMEKGEKNYSHSKAKVEPIRINEENVVDEEKILKRNPEIFELYKKGLSITEIAKTLNIGQGEVKLIIELATK